MFQIIKVSRVIKSIIILSIISLILIAVINTSALTPIITGDETSYIVNTQNILHKLNLLDTIDYPWIKRPIGYSLSILPGYYALNVLGIATAENTYSLFVYSNTFFFILSGLIQIKILQFLPRRYQAYKNIIFLLLISLSGPVFYNFFSVAESLIYLIVITQLALGFYALKHQFNNIKFLSSLLFMTFLSFFFTITKETGFISVIFPFLISTIIAIKRFHKQKNIFQLSLTTLFPILIFSLMIFGYRWFLNLSLHVDFLDRGGNISFAYFFNSIRDPSIIFLILKKFIKIVIGHILYFYTYSLGFLGLSIYLLIRALNNIRTKDFKEFTIRETVHYISTIMVVASIIFSSLFFSFYSAIGTLRFDHYFYERYTLPFFTVYLVSFFISSPWEYLHKKKWPVLFNLLAIVSLSTILVIRTMTSLYGQNFNYPSLVLLFNITPYTFLFVMIYFFVIYLLSSFSYFSRKTKALSIYLGIILVLSLTSLNLYFLYNKYYFPEQSNKYNSRQIVTYIEDHLSEIGTICYLRNDFVAFEYWHHRYYMGFMNIRLPRVNKDELDECNALIVNKSTFESDLFDFVSKLNTSDTRLYVKRSSVFSIPENHIDPLNLKYDYSLQAVQDTQDIIEIDIKNLSSSAWPNSSGFENTQTSVRIGYAHDIDNLYTGRSYRCELPNIIYPNMETTVKCNVPKELQNKEIIIDLVHEGITWFHQKTNNKPITVKLLPKKLTNHD